MSECQRLKKAILKDAFKSRAYAAVIAYNDTTDKFREIIAIVEAATEKDASTRMTLIGCVLDPAFQTYNLGRLGQVGDTWEDEPVGTELVPVVDLRAKTLFREEAK